MHHYKKGAKDLEELKPGDVFEIFFLSGIVRKTPLRTLHNLRLANEHTSFLLRIEACMPTADTCESLRSSSTKFSVMYFSVVASATNWRMHWIARQIWRGNIVWDTQQHGRADYREKNQLKPLRRAEQLSPITDAGIPSNPIPTTRSGRVVKPATIQEYVWPDWPVA